MIESMEKKMGIINRFRSVIPGLEKLFLVFPCVVVSLLAVVFLCQGQCAAWIWYVSFFATTLGYMSWRRFSRAAWIVVATFISGIVGIWMIVGVGFSSFYDGLAYHLPAVRLMIHGWNPFWQGTIEGIASMGYDPNESWFLHILAMPKSVWYFDAVAYFFFRDAWNVLFPILPFVFVPSVLAVWDLFRDARWQWKLMLVFLLIVLLPMRPAIVDNVVMLSAIALLSSLYIALTRNEWNWCRLICFSFWMCTAKQTSLLHCALFWGLFSALYLRTRVQFVRLCLVAVALLGAVCIVNAAPYFSAWMHYGHPLYPQYTVDETRFPPHDITSDFYNQNKDAHAVGHIGRYVSAFFTKDAVNAFHRWRSKKREFSPSCLYWQGDSPTTTTFKAIFVLSLIVVFGFGNRQMKLMTCMVLCCLLCMPTKMVGYVRYTPWVYFPSLLALLICATSRRCFWRRTIILSATLPVAGCLLYDMAKNAYVPDERAALNEWLGSGEKLERIYVEPLQYGVAFEGIWYIRGLNARLLTKEIPALAGSEVEHASKEDLDGLTPSFDYSFWVADKGLVNRYSMWRKMQDGILPKTKWNYLLCCIRAWTLDFARCLCDRVQMKGI